MKKWKMGLVIYLVLTVMCIAMTGACAPAESVVKTTTSPPQSVYVMRFSSHFPPLSPDNAIFAGLVEVIDKETNGRVKFEFYPGAALYNLEDALAGVQTGALEMTVGGLFAAPISPEANATQLPFLFEDAAHIIRFTESDAYQKYIIDSMQTKGVHVLKCYFRQATDEMVAGDFYNKKKPIATLEDFKGIKMRMPGLPMHMILGQYLGFESVSLPPTELVTALETGMVDGTIGTYAGIVALKFAEVAPYRTKCFAMTGIQGNLLVSKKWWDNLPPDLQKIIEQVFLDAGDEIDIVLAKAAATAFDDFEATTGTVTTEVTGAELERWKGAVQPIWDQERAKSASIRAMIEAIENLR